MLHCPAQPHPAHARRQHSTLGRKRTKEPTFMSCAITVLIAAVCAACSVNVTMTCLDAEAPPVTRPRTLRGRNMPTGSLVDLNAQPHEERRCAVIIALACNSTEPPNSHVLRSVSAEPHADQICVVTFAPAADDHDCCCCNATTMQLQQRSNASAQLCILPANTHVDDGWLSACISLSAGVADDGCCCVVAYCDEAPVVSMKVR